MDNIETKKIESGITVNAAKKVKISNWNELVKNAKELSANINFSKVDNQSNWDLVSISDSVALNNASKPIRIIGSGVDQARKSWDNYRHANNINSFNDVPTNIIDTDENVANSENEMGISNNLKDFGYNEDFSSAVENVVEQPTFEPYNFEVPRFDEYEKEETNDQEITTVNNDEQYDDAIEYSEIEHMVEEAMKESEITAQKQDNEEEKYNLEDMVRNSLDEYQINKDNNSEKATNVSFSAENLQINDIMKEITELTESNNNLKGNIASIKDRNIKMQKSIDAIERETKEYEEASLRNARELLIRTKEEQEKLRREQENGVQEGRDLKDKLISADETNLSAKKRSEYLYDMLNDNSHSESYEEEIAYRKVA